MTLVESAKAGAARGCVPARRLWFTD